MYIRNGYGFGLSYTEAYSLDISEAWRLYIRLADRNEVESEMTKQATK